MRKNVNYYKEVGAVHNGNMLLASQGNILMIDELIAASISTYSGMSGGPLCIIRERQWYAIGFLICSHLRFFISHTMR